MDNIQRVMLVVDFIEKNLKNNITIKEVSSKILISNFYFHKLFKLFTGESPGKYLTKRRLFEAANMLKESQMKVIDVALEFGYDSPEAFSRAFKRNLGINPIDIKHNPEILIRFGKSILSLKDLKHLNEGVNMKPIIVEKEEIKIVGPIYYGDNKNNEIPSFWQENFGEVVNLETKRGQGCYGFCFHKENYIEKGLFYYMPSVEVKNFNIIPSNSVAKIIPKHKYAIFIHKGSPEDLEETYKFIHGTWFPNKEYSLNEDFDFEFYTTDEENNEVIEIHIPIIDK